MHKETIVNEIIGIILLLFSFIVFLAIASFDINDYQQIIVNNSVENIIGPLGALMSHFFRSSFGKAAYLLSILFGLFGWNYLQGRNVSDMLGRVFSLFFMIISLSAVFGIFGNNIVQFAGGYIGLYLKTFLLTVFGKVGSYLIIAIMNIIGLMLLGIISITAILERKHANSSLRSTLLDIKAKLNPFAKLSIKNAQIAKDEPYNTFPKGEKKKKRPWITRETILVKQNKSKKNIDKDLLLPIPENFPVIPSDVSDEKINDAIAIEFDTTVSTTAVATEIPEISDHNAQEDLTDDFHFDRKIPDEFDDFTIENHTQNKTETGTITNSGFRIKSIEPETAETDEELIQPAPQEELQNTTAATTDDAEDFKMESYKDNLSTSSGLDDAVNEVKKTEVDLKRPFDERPIFDHISLSEDYTIPATVFETSTPLDSENWKLEIKKNSVLLVNTLADFGIESRVIHVHRGPVITLYELQIAPGIKVNRIVGLSDDIAMALAAYRVRIVAPIPGKSAVGVEIPNSDREYVTMGDIVKSDDYKASKGVLTVALGKDILGKPIMLDIKKLPHLLIAGATG